MKCFLAATLLVLTGLSTSADTGDRDATDIVRDAINQQPSHHPMVRASRESGLSPI